MMLIHRNNSKSTVTLFMAMCLSITTVYGQLLSPNDFLPHDLGEHFTPHHQLVDYYQHVAAESDHVQLIEYGRTNQGRPLLAAFVSTPDNLNNLEPIRKNNLAKAGMPEGEASAHEAVIVWLGFTVHGNEAAGAESSMRVIHKLADPDNETTKEWLQNTVVIIDPCVNPDGYSRYTHWVRDVTGSNIITDLDDIEHHEPWPGGRVNHYLFDLNRDWAWQTQTETKHRIKLYNQWLPHIVADLHEMGHNSPYYFAPAARPYHNYITEWQRDFQEEIGKNHAGHFDKRGWLYYTKEIFDLFYPSYGDTYPTFNGAIGMTYEQGGSARAGRAVEGDNGEILTLYDRIDHHRVSALSTVEVASNNAERIITEFENFYKKNDKLGKYKSYIIKSDKQSAKTQALADMLTAQGIIVQVADANSSSKGYNYYTQKESTFSVESGDLIISADQPKSTLLQVLLDPTATLEDSLTYDITAWALPYAYGLDAYASMQAVSTVDVYEKAMDKRAPLADKAYAYVIRPNGMVSQKAIMQLLSKGVKVRYNTVDIEIDDRQYPMGSFFILRGDNKSVEDAMQSAITSMSDQCDIESLKTGFAISGADLGSNKLKLIKQPKILVVSGDNVRANAYGEVKYYFNELLDYDMTTVDIGGLGRVKLDKYNTIILPDGRYRLSDDLLERFSDFCNQGGKLILMAGAVPSVADKSGFALKSYEEDDIKSSEEKESKHARLAARYNHYCDRERNNISSYIPGAIFKNVLDASHPMAYGMGTHYYSLKTNSLRYPMLTGASNVAYLEGDPTVIGFAGSKIKKKLSDAMTISVQSKGRGQVVYMVDNPLFRAFWYNGMQMFGNALLYVGG